MGRLDLISDNTGKYEEVTLSVIQESNNFGDQLLTFCDHTSGSFKKFFNVESEGCWEDFTKDNMLRLATRLGII